VGTAPLVARRLKYALIYEWLIKLINRIVGVNRLKLRTLYPPPRVSVCLAAGTFLWEARLGCLEATIPRRTQEFIDATQAMMSSSVYLIIGDKWHQRLNTPVWRKHKDAWDKMFQISA